MIYKLAVYSKQIVFVLFMIMTISTRILVAQEVDQGFAQEVEQSFILVEGKGQIEVPVEYLELKFNISKIEKNAIDATSYTEELLDTVFTDLKSIYNIEDDELYTENVGLNAEYEYNNTAGARRKTLVGFNSRINVVLKLYEYENYADIINTIVSLGVEGIDSLNYIPSQDPKYYREALLIAYDDAQQKANVLMQTFENEVYVSHRQIAEIKNTSAPYQQEVKLLARDSPIGQNLGVRSTYAIEARISMKVYFSESE